MGRVRVGKSTDGLVGNADNKKPRHYAVIDGRHSEIAISKIQTHDTNKTKHVQRMQKKLRTPVKRFGENSVLDKTLYTSKKDGSPIKHSDLDYEKSNFEFTNNESLLLRKFVFENEKNRQRYYEFVKKQNKKK